MRKTRTIGDDMNRAEYARHLRRQNLKLAADGVKSAIRQFEKRIREADGPDDTRGAYVPASEASTLYDQLQQMIVDIRTAERQESDAREQTKREGGGNG